MGKERNIKKDRGHLRKLFNGKSAEEVWRSHLGGKCKCGRPAAMELLMFLPVDDAIKDMPEFMMKTAAKNGGKIPVIMFKGPGGEPRKFVRALHAFACEMCRKDLEHWAAKAPSYAVVEIRNGPGPDKPMVQVAG